MAIACIILDDNNLGPDGSPAIAVECTFDGGWNPESPAHQHAKAMLGLMDTIAVRQGPTREHEPTAVTQAALEAAKQHVFGRRDH